MQVDATIRDDLWPRRRKNPDASSIASSLPARQPLVVRPAAAARLALAATYPRDIIGASVSDASAGYSSASRTSETVT